MRAKRLAIITLGLSLVGCQGTADEEAELDSSPGTESSTGEDGSSGGAAGSGPSAETTAGPSSDTTSATTTGAGTSTTGADATGSDASDDSSSGDDETTSSATDSASETGEVEDMAVLNIESVASPINGDLLTIANYTVPADGVLVVRGGAAGRPVESVTFGGEALTAIASHEEPDYWFAISADMYWMPVTAGESGEIVWQYPAGEWTTRRRSMTAVTISGVDEVHALVTGSDGLGTNEGRTGPTGADLEITTTQDAVVLTAFTSNGWGPSDLIGPGHTLDAYPTVPIEEFHSTRVYSGHVRVGPGTVRLGYQNTEAIGWFDYILFHAAFTRSG